MSGFSCTLRSRRLVGPILAAGLALSVQPAAASEGGASVYLLGSGGPGAAVLPPVEGVFLDNTFYFYDASISAERPLVVGGNVVAGLDVFLAAEFSTFLWVPTTNFAGGTLAIGAAVPIGAPIIDVSAVLTGPQGGQLAVSRHDATLALGDPIVTAMLGWQDGNLHVTASGLVNIPVGHYREGELANIAFHRWAGDVSVAATWHDKESGWDVSGKMGFTFNGNNDYTNYNTGDEFHLEAAVEKTFSPKFSAGVLGYYYKQLSGDTGEGAVLGPNEGEVAAVGATAAFNTVLGRSPATVRFRLLQEFGAERRPEGTAAFVSLTLPLSMKLPPHGE